MNQKGFVSLILIGVIVLFVGALGYLLISTRSEGPPMVELTKTYTTQVSEPTQELSEDERRAKEAIEKFKKGEQSAPPSGYLIPSDDIIPKNFILEWKRFTQHGVHYHYSNKPGSIFSAPLNISERDSATLKATVKRETGSKVQDVRVVREFTYLNSPGVVLGEFPFPENDENEEPNEYWLHYDHNGRLVTIHTTDTDTFDPEKLIELLKKLKPAP